MSKSHRHFVIAYVVFVGLPILILLGILRLGRGLTSPVSVNGNWKIESAASLADGHCPIASPLNINSSFVISQSGPNLRVALSGSKSTGVIASGTIASGMIATGTIADGTIDGQTVKVSIPSSRSNPADSTCGGDQPLTLTATVDAHAEPRTLTGTLSADHCANCEPLQFRAVRQPRLAGEGR
jgi:hypothetical protein